MKTEYRVRVKEVYYITRFRSEGNTAGCECLGQHDSAETAYQVAYALAKAEHERLGYPIGDERIKYPEHPERKDAQPVT